MLEVVLSPISKTEERIGDSIKLNLLETGYENVKDMEVTQCRVDWPNLVSAVYLNFSVNRWELEVNYIKRKFVFFFCSRYC
jgi:hypothetical protein